MRGNQKASEGIGGHQKASEADLRLQVLTDEQRRLALRDLEERATLEHRRVDELNELAAQLRGQLACARRGRRRGRRRGGEGAQLVEREAGRVGGGATPL